MTPQTPAASQGNILSIVNQDADGASSSDGQNPPLPKGSGKSFFSRFRLPSLKNKKFLKIFLGFVALVVFLVVISIYPAIKIATSATQAEKSARETYDALKHQDLILAKDKLSETKAHLGQANKFYQFLVFYKATPLYWHYTDGQRLLKAANSGLEAGEILLTSIEPYADVIGFTGEGTFTGGTAEERIIKILETLDKVTPALDEVAVKLQDVQTNINKVNPKRYPFKVRGKSVSDLLIQGQTLTDTAVIAVTDVKPIIEVLPEVAGLNEEKKYLVIFQNDAEIRPTGGFMTAYAVLRVDKGRVFSENNDDIYNLDNKFNSRIKPPAPIEKYLPLVFYWNLRDMNLSPDFKVSMDTFLEHYFTIPSEPDKLDGVIAIDTQVLSSLIEVLGPVEVPGFGTFSSENDERCDCPQVIYELEDFATRPVGYVRDDRKAFLGPMMQTLILKAYGSPKNIWPKLFETIVDSAVQKHTLFYMFEEKARLAAEQVNIAGRVKESDGDYLMIVDSNFGGAKSNLFITEEINLAISTTDSGTTNNLDVTYKNPAPASNCNLEAGQLCLNGTFRDYVRFYLPLGSTLTQSLGFEEDTIETHEELGKTVVEGFFQLLPESQAKLKLTYDTPYQPQDIYNFLIQKQPGKKLPSYTVTLNDTVQEKFELTSDKNLQLKL